MDNNDNNLNKTDEPTKEDKQEPNKVDTESQLSAEKVSNEEVDQILAEAEKKVEEKKKKGEIREQQEKEKENEDKEPANHGGEIQGLREKAEEALHKAKNQKENEEE